MSLAKTRVDERIFRCEDVDALLRKGEQVARRH
jgi:hypothetical protein